MIKYRSRALGLILTLALVSCGDNVTDCYEMRQAEGTRPSNGDFCLCTFMYPSGDPSTGPVGPPCDVKCQDKSGQAIPRTDCNAVPPL
jgi:hypothetical protein